MELTHPNLVNVPVASMLLFALFVVIQQRHYVLEYEEQQRVNQRNLDEAVALMNF